MTTSLLARDRDGVPAPGDPAGAGLPVHAWNGTFLQLVREEGGAPGPLARTGAILHLGIHDALVAIAPTHAPFRTGLTATGTEDGEAAVHRAAHTVLAAAYPHRRTELDAVLASREAALPAPGPARRGVLAGRRLGVSAARAVLADRVDDGHDDATPYAAGTAPGEWRSAAPTVRPVTPNWGQVRPFSLPAGDAPEGWRASFRPPLPAEAADVPSLLATAEYASQLADVRTVGGATSTVRTAEQTAIAHFWANDLDGTYKPPGQLFELTRVVSAAQGTDLAGTARLFALAAVALADAAIVAWDAKYDTELDLWRPDTAIQLAAQDGNPATDADPLWQPLSPAYGGGRFSPAFPAYVSGHATFAASHCRMMENFFGRDEMDFELGTDDPFAPGATRTFRRFSEAAQENGRSRVYLGVHYQWDADMGYKSGRRLADHVFATLLTRNRSRRAGADPDGAPLS